MRVSVVLRQGVVGLAAASMLGCAPIEPRKPIERTAEATTTYILAKREYVQQLDRALRTGTPTASPYSLVAITGPQWRVGEVIDPENPLNVITEKCVFPSSKLPSTPAKWSSLPGLTQEKKIDMSAGLPQSVLKVLGKDNKVGVNFKLDQTGTFRLEDLESVIVPQDSFEAGLSSDCREVLALRGGLVVRGIVSGKEVFKSGGNLDTGADLKILEEQIFKVKYTDKGDFELQDKAITPKMFLVALYPKQDKSTGTGAKPLSSSERAKLEAAFK